jgi:hypothetical protein
MNGSKFRLEKWAVKDPATTRAKINAGWLMDCIQMDFVARAATSWTGRLRETHSLGRKYVFIISWLISAQMNFCSWI